MGYVEDINQLVRGIESLLPGALVTFHYKRNPNKLCNGKPAYDWELKVRVLPIPGRIYPSEWAGVESEWHGLDPEHVLRDKSLGILKALIGLLSDDVTDPEILGPGALELMEWRMRPGVTSSDLPAGWFQ